MNPPALAADAAAGCIAAILTAVGGRATAARTVFGAGATLGAGAALAARGSAGLGRVSTPLAEVCVAGVWIASAVEASGCGAEAGLDEPKRLDMLQPPPDELWDAGSGAGEGVGAAAAAAGFDEPKTLNMLQPPPDGSWGAGSATALACWMPAWDEFKPIAAITRCLPSCAAFRSLWGSVSIQSAVE
jgi:hypothetical protein